MKEDKVSSTALTVLQGILYRANKKETSHLVSDEMSEACRKILNSTKEGQKRLNQLDSKLFNFSVPIVENLMMPGITLHYVMRKKYIEEYSREAIERGFTQVINLGAGFDTLAYRLSKEFSDISFIEIDHPATQVHKQEALQDANRDNLHLLCVDFSKQNLKDELKNFDGFDPNKNTLFICEGVLMYLDEDSVKELFASLKELTNADMEFIFTFIEPMKENLNSYGLLLKLYLKIKKEDLNWSIKRDRVKEFLESIGYIQKELLEIDYFRKNYLKGLANIRLHESEFIAVAK
ncbi:MAG: class I SAM-dependent methyltransferase [Sulfurovum sp.]